MRRPRFVAADVSRLKFHSRHTKKGLPRKGSDPAHAGCYKQARTSRSSVSEGANYKAKLKAGRYSDVFSLGGILFYLVTGPSAICGGNGCRSLAPRLVVIAVIAILASLLLPSLAKAKAKAQTVSCLSNLRQLTLCWLMYADDNVDSLPPNVSLNTLGDGVGTQAGWTTRAPSWLQGNAYTDTALTNIQNGLLFP